jgi:hypothetical protein
VNTGTLFTTTFVTTPAATVSVDGDTNEFGAAGRLGIAVSGSLVRFEATEKPTTIETLL